MKTYWFGGLFLFCFLMLCRAMEAGSTPGLRSTDGPDLTVTAATTSTNNPSLGASFDVSWTVRNDGNEPAYGQYNQWTDAVYYSPTEELDGSEVYLGDWGRSGSDVPLGIGLSYVSSLTVTMSRSAPPGPGWLVFVTDAWGDVTETDEANNHFALPITVETPDVDLHIVATDAPATAQMGGDMLLSWRVTNAGSEAASSQWYDTVYISEDDTLGPEDELLGGWGSYVYMDSISPLAGGGSYDVSETYPVPTHFPNGATAYLFFATDTYVRDDVDSDHRDPDFTGLQIESNERNNVAMRTIVLTAPDVDLVVSSATVPDTIQNSGTATVSFTVHNQGAVETVNSEHYDAVFFSTDATWDEHDNWLWEYHRDSAVPAGASYSVTNQSIPVHYNVPAGPGYLLFMADKWGHQAETNKANNVRAVPVIVLPPDVDLTITAASAPTVAAPGAYVSFSWTVQNIGTAQATAIPWGDTVYLSTNMTLEKETDIVVATGGRYSRLAAGASYTITASRSLPEDIAPGPYYLIFSADDENLQAESNEDNNMFTRSITIAGPDLAMMEATAPAEIAPGLSTTFVWTVENVGAGPTGARYDGVYVSADAEWDVDDFLQFERYDATPMSPGDSHVLTNAHVFTNKLPLNGSAFLLFVADSRNSVGETTKTNNLLAKAVTFVGADLHVTTSSVSSTTLSLGGSVEVSHTVRNDGNASAEGGSAAPGTGWYDGWYLSRNTKLDSGDVQLTQTWAGAHAPLAVGASYTFSAELALSSSNQFTGAGYLLAVTDRTSLQKEAGTAPNVRAIPVNVLGPDLALTDATAPATMAPGQEIEVTWT